jgi:hypothetical protein
MVRDSNTGNPEHRSELHNSAKFLHEDNIKIDIENTGCVWTGFTWLQPESVVGYFECRNTLERME